MGTFLYPGQLAQCTFLDQGLSALGTTRYFRAGCPWYIFVPRAACPMYSRESITWVKTLRNCISHNKAKNPINLGPKWKLLFSSFQKLLKDCWKTAERLLKDCWKTAERLLKDCWKTAERQLRDSWETAERQLEDLSKNYEDRAKKSTISQTDTQTHRVASWAPCRS